MGSNVVLGVKMPKFTTLFEALAGVQRRDGTPLYVPTDRLPPGTRIDVETHDMLNERYSELLEEEDREGLLILTAGQSFYLVALENWPSFAAVGLDKVPTGTVCKLRYPHLSPEATFQANVSLKDQNYTIQTGTIVSLEVQHEGQRHLLEETR
jgi:hypothetical protein